jgi:protein-tyrosine phosphatase
MSPLALFFPLLGISLITLAVTHAHHSAWWWLAAWCGLSCLAVGIAYAGAGPRVFGKTPHGSRRWWTYPLLLPFFAYMYPVTWIRHRLSREPAAHEVLPNLWVGRWPGRNPLPNNITLVIDMTAEFTRGRSTRHAAYTCYPTLDFLAASPDHARAAVQQILAHPGAVYLHCAFGHGRSAAIAALVLLARKQAATLDDALAHLRHIRPGIRLSRHQRALIRALANPSLHPPAIPTP